MMTLSVLSLAGSLFAVATPTANYRHPAVHATQPTQVVRLTRQWVADGRGQVWRPAPANATPPASAPVTQARTFLSVGR
jgi:hypothetical protein